MISKTSAKAVAGSLVLLALGVSMLGFQSVNNFPLRSKGPIIAGHCAQWVDSRTAQDSGAVCGGGTTGVTAAGTLANGNVVTGAGAKAVQDSGIAAANLVTSSSPGAGLAHFAGATQAVTSSPVVNADITNATIDLTTKVTGLLPPANAGVANISVADQGYFIGPNLTQAGLATSTGAVVSAGQQVRACQFVLPWRQKVTSMTITVVGTVGSSTITTGIYDAAGTTKLIDSGTFDGGSATTQKNTITPVTIGPGAFWFAQSASTQTTLTATVVQSAAGMATVINNDTNKLCGQAANAATAGVLPSSLGAITGTNYGFLVAAFKP